MNRREVVSALLGIVGSCGHAGQVTVDSREGIHSDQLFIVKFNDDCEIANEEAVKTQILTCWNGLWPEGKAPRLLIVAPGMQFAGPLPGKYAVHETLGEYTKIVTFQTVEEMNNYLKSVDNWKPKKK